MREDSQAMRVDEDDNFTIDLHDDGVVMLRVWKRPDLPFEKGAALARRMLATASALARDDRAKGLVFDLRDAPVLTGPRTRGTLAELVGAWEAAGKRVGVLLLPGVQRMTLEPDLARAARTCARFADVPEQARDWALGAATSP